MVTTSGLWLLLAACVAAYDNYDETGMIDFKGDMLYYDDGDDIDSGQFKLSLHDLMMLKLISSMSNEDSDDWRLHPVVNTMENQMLGWAHNPGTTDFKRNLLKKRNPGTATDKEIKVKPRYQPRWRIKRPPRLCLLKLCPSMYYTYE